MEMQPADAIEAVAKAIAPIAGGGGMNSTPVFVQALANFARFVVLSLATRWLSQRVANRSQVMGVVTFALVVLSGISLFA